MYKLSDRAYKRLRRSCDWMKIEKAVHRYINEDSDFFTVDIGGFSVRFDATNKEQNNGQ